MRGIIKTISVKRNQGFIRGDGESFDRFFHAGAMNPKAPPLADLEVGAVVEFHPTEHERGMRAVNVLPVNEIEM